MRINVQLGKGIADSVDIARGQAVFAEGKWARSAPYTRRQLECYPCDGPFYTYLNSMPPASAVLRSQPLQRC